ncbi:hypothetical protein C2S52_014526 [Perilla frutescens var. hirtella]|nr:hypothetical protein C2S52_014526 [Perilla frutescens var. hirtella]KAH6816624.1 hypothetical protein C2S51_021444 [Perilla frutescens var. frutescens]
MNKLKSGDTMDRLSELPDSLILKIISSLDMKDVVGTTLLSKRWNNLWTTIPCLCFSNYVSHDNVEKIRNFINRALLLWKGTKILKFNFFLWGCIKESSYRDVNLWLRFVTEKKVEELHLCLISCDETLIPLPNCLYECSSIRKLSLLDCNLHIRGDVRWDQLKSLTIQCSSAGEYVINRLVSGAPQLEIFELTISNAESCEYENLIIPSCSLKKLSIHNKYPYSKTEYDPSMYAVLIICAPNLETLIISGCPYNECLLMDVSSLTDVTLDFEDGQDVVLGETLRQILPTFQHVEKLSLSSWCLKVLAVMKGEYSFSPLSNVKLLRLTHHNLIKPNEIVGLLEIFPKVKMLNISQRRMVYSKNYPVKLPEEQDTGEPLNSEVSTIKSLMVQLRIVEIGWEEYEKSIFQFIEFFLEHATMLEKIVIQKRGFMSVQLEEMILAGEKLLSLQRSFPTVELIFCNK